MEATRVEIFRDGLWRKLKLQDGSAIKYNALINRIGKIDSREISHTNTFSLLSIFLNTDALGINQYNKTSLAKALNSKFPAKYYVDDKLLQQGFLIINNTSDGEINVNFIDEALEITEKWGSTTFRELLADDTIIKPEDYRLAILEMTGYNMSRTSVLQPLTQVGDRGYNLALFPNALNAIGDNFQQPTSGERLDDTFNPYQSRAIYNAKALFDLAVESFGYTPEYDSSIDWAKVAQIYMIEEGLDQNKIEDEGQVKNTFPTLSRWYNWRWKGRRTNGWKGTIWTYVEGDNIIKPIDIPGYVHPSGYGMFPGGDSSDQPWVPATQESDYTKTPCILQPDITSAAFGDIKYRAGVYHPDHSDEQIATFFAVWENSSAGGNVIHTILEKTDEDFGYDDTINEAYYAVTIKKGQLANKPNGSSGKLHGILMLHEHKFHHKYQYKRTYYLYNLRASETFLLEDIVSYDEEGQYIADNINLQHSAPNKTIKELLSGIMQKEGILLNINSKTKVVKFFSYSAYRDRRDSGIQGDFYDWSDYFQEYVSPKFNTDYGDNYAKKNQISLTDPYLGNTYDFLLQNQGADSKYKDFKEIPVKLFKDVEDIRKINNTNAPYYEYKNLGLGLVESTTTLAGLTQVRTDGSLQGAIPYLNLVANINYAYLPSGVREWYNLVDKAIRGSSTFLLPVKAISELDLSKPIYVEGLGGFFIIEEVEEYIDGSTPVLVKLIKLIEPTEAQDVLANVTQFVGRYGGSTSHSATLRRITNDMNLGGTYGGISNYSATIDFDYPDKYMVGNYLGSSLYSALLIGTKSLKNLTGSYATASSYIAQLIIEKKKFLLRTDDTFTGVLDVVGEVKVTEKIHTPEIVLDTHSLTWNDTEHTVNVPTGKGATIQVGQELLIHVYNATGSTLLDGSVVRVLGSSTNGLPNVDYAIANSHETISNQVGLLTSNILSGDDGFMTVKGGVRDLNTENLTVGAVYISPTALGGLTSTKPLSPNYAALVGTVLVSSATVGKILVDIQKNIYDTFNNFWNGTIRESFTAHVSSNGTVITVNLMDTLGRGKLTLLWSSGLYTLNTPAAITLPQGATNLPRSFYVYIPFSTKVLTYSEVGFPLSEQHIKIAATIVQSAADVLEEGPLKLRYYNDEVSMEENQQGHLSHITERLRQEHARYSSGIDFINTVSATSNQIQLTAGIIYLLHKQTYQAQNMATGSHVHIINHLTNPYAKTTNLNTVVNNALGEPLANSSFSFVLWGIANSGGLHSKMMINLPIGSYAKNAPETAVSDPNNYSVYDIPTNFNGTGFLIARFTYVKQANGNWSLYATQDLRGRDSGVAGGATGGSGGVTSFSALTDTPASYATFANWLVRVDSSEAGLQYVAPKTSLLLNDGEDGTNKYLDTLDLGVTVQPYSSQAAFKNVDNDFSVAQTAPNYFSNNIATQNNHLVRLDQLNSIVSGIRWSDSVDEIYDNTTALPTSPTNGDRYISLVTANGWIVNNIYEWMSGQWVEFISEQGMTVTVYSLDTNYTFNGTNWVEFGTTLSHNNMTGLQGGTNSQYYHLTSSQHSNLTAIDTANIAYKNQANTFTENQTITGKMIVSSSVRVGDDVTTATASNVGAIRYRTTANGSYADMCMQKGPSLYLWINIVKNEW